MANLLIKGGNQLHGKIATNSAKNSAVAILCATAMIPGITIIDDMPRIEEVNRIMEILASIGIKFAWLTNSRLQITVPKKIQIENIDADNFVKTRSALLLMGALAHQFPKFRLPKSGGCKLGKRTVNPFIIAMEHLGAKIKETDKYYEIAAKNLIGAEFTMYEISDTATENAMMAAIFAHGKTIINFASPNYMVRDLAEFLVTAGAKIKWEKNSRLIIDGVKTLKPVKNYPIMPDPIESMAFISIAIVTKSKLKITNCPLEFLRMELEKLRIMGQKYILSKPRKSKNGIFEIVDIDIIPSKLMALPDKIHPLPYPGLNIDNLPLFVPILTQAHGDTMVHDWVYENRAIYYTELSRLGAEIMLHDPHRVTVSGPTELKANEIVCPPALRPSINLLICMLAAKGQSILRNSYAIDRGYENLYERLKTIGADIELL